MHAKLDFYGGELLDPHPIPKLEDHLLSAVCDYLLTYPKYNNEHSLGWKNIVYFLLQYIFFVIYHYSLNNVLYIINCATFCQRW